MSQQKLHVRELLTDKYYTDFSNLNISEEKLKKIILKIIEAAKTAFDSREPLFNAIIDITLMLISERISNNEEYSKQELIEIVDHIHSILNTKYFVSAAIDWSKVKEDNIDSVVVDIIRRAHECK